jgi:hypothetical protein
MSFERILTAIAVAAQAAPPRYRIVAILGQSNSVSYGAYDGAADAVDARVLQYGGIAGEPATYRQIVPVNGPLRQPNITYNPSQTNFNGIGHSFGQAYLGQLGSGEKVLLVPCAVGGMAILGGVRSWCPAGGRDFEFAVSQVAGALAAAQAVYPGSYIDGAIIIQGESDGDAGITQAQYAAASGALMAEFRQRTGAANAWFVWGSMVPEAIANRGGSIQQIDLAHKAIPTTIPRTAFVSGISGQTADNLHYLAPAVRTMGANMAAAVSTAIANTSPVVPAEPAAVTLSSTAQTSSRIDLSWTAASGTSDYIVEYKRTVDATWQVYADAIGATTSTSITGLSSGTAYEFQVFAYNAGGVGPASNTLTVSTQAAAAQVVRMQTLANVIESGSAANWGYAWSAGNLNTSIANSPTPVAAANADFVLSARLAGVAASGSSVFGVHTDATATAYSGMAHGVYNNTGTGKWSVITGGATGVTPSGSANIAATVGDIARYSKTGTTLVAEISKDSGATWTNLHTWAGATARVPVLGFGASGAAIDTISLL